MWKKINKKSENFSFQKTVPGIVSLLLAIYLLATSSLRAQNVIIEGKIILEPARKTVKTNLGGYQNVPQGSNFSEADSLSNDVVIWLEAKDKNISDSTDGNQRILDQVDKHFKPRLMVIRVGDVVRIHNSDPVYHNVFSLSQTKRFDVGRRSPDDYQDVKFDNAGKVDVFCDIHSDMHAVIVVVPKQTVATQRVDSGDTFRFTDIPQGEYILHVYALGDQNKQIDIQAGDAKKITLETIRLGS